MKRNNPGNIVWAYVTTAKPYPPALWPLMVAEFESNGRRMLTPGKMRYLRRVLRRGAGSR